jgi:hypothetical protein
VTFDDVVYESVHAQLQVAPRIVVTNAPVDVVKANDDTHTFSVAISGGYAPISYQWKKDGTTIGGATNASHTLNNISSADAGVYSVEISDSGTDSEVVSARLTVSAGVPALGASGLALLGVAIALARRRMIHK